uniref:Uncharacterized protein n=1 Tax=viral metagenome TaxID=1070528 RepID=A0A6M3K6U6_9ZZZZ
MPDAGLTAAILAFVGVGASMVSQNQANKQMKRATETQAKQAQASQEALVARETAAKEEVKQAQATATAQAKGVVTEKRRAIARSQTIYTSPLGIGGTADVSRKVLLGQ